MKTQDQMGGVTFARPPFELGLIYKITRNVAIYVGSAALSLTGHNLFHPKVLRIPEHHLFVLRSLFPSVPTIIIFCFNLTSASPKL